MEMIKEYTESYTTEVLEENPETAPEENLPRICIKDHLRAAQVGAGLGNVNRLNEFRKNVRMEDVTMALFEQEYSSRKSDIYSVGHIKFLVNDKNGLHNPKEQTPSVLEANNRSSRRWDSYFGGYLRRLLPGSDVERGLIAKCVSMQSKTFLREDGGTAFAMRILPQEFTLMMAHYFGAIDWEGVEVIESVKGILEEDQVLYFENGLEANGLCETEKEPIDGEFTIKFLNGKPYATLPLSEVIAVPEATNHLVVRLHASEVHRYEEIKTFMATEPGYLTANMVEGDYLVLGTKRFRLDFPSGKSLISQDADYAQVRWEEGICGEVKFFGSSVAEEDKLRKAALICFMITGRQEHEEIKPVMLQTAAQRKANPVVQEALFDEGL